MANPEFDKITGKIKETAGKVTGNEDLEAEGRLENASGKIREAAEDAAATIKAAGRKLKDAVTSDDDSDDSNDVTAVPPPVV